MPALNGPSSNIAPSDDAAPPPLSPAQIFLRFLRFGLLAWGGPVAQIAMVRRELVDEERWLTSSRFNRLLAVYQVLPGPEAHELCVHMGMMAGRRLGGLLAGLGFMLPGFVLMMLLAWLYSTVDISRTALGPVFLGVQVGVIALIVRAVHRIGEHALVDAPLWTIGVASAAATMLGVEFWIVLPAAGFAYTLAKGGHLALAAAVLCGAAIAAWLLGSITALSPQAAATAPAGAEATVAALFLSGLKAGLLTFGGAYTAIPFLRDDAVGRGWMTDAQFLDGVALAGILPAPLIIFSTFVGYVAGGPWGAVAMTAGVFLPAFGFTLILYDRLEALVDNRTLHGFLEGVTAGVVGMIAATTVELAAALLPRLPAILPAILIFALGLAILYLWKSKLNVMAVVAVSALLGAYAFR
jgi:chromate transporter